MHTCVDGRHLGSSQPISFFDGQSHHVVGHFERTRLFRQSLFPSVVLIALASVSNSQFQQRPILIGFVAVVITREPPPHRSESSKFLTNLIVGIDTSLQGIKSLGFVARMFLESFHMIETHIAAQTPFWRQLHILPQTIEQGSRELRIESHVVSSYANDVIRTAVTVAYGDVALRQGSAISHHVDGRQRINIHQTNFMAKAVVRQIDEAYLPTFRTLAGDVQQTDLRSVE